VLLPRHPRRRRHRERSLEIIAGTAKDRSGPMEPYEALVCQVPRDGGE